MAFEIGYHIITAAHISFRARDVFAVTPFTKYRLGLAGTSLFRITAGLRERRGARDIRHGTQYSYRAAPAPLDAHRQLFLPHTDCKPKDSWLAGHSDADDQ